MNPQFDAKLEEAIESCTRLLEILKASRLSPETKAEVQEALSGEEQ